MIGKKCPACLRIVLNKKTANSRRLYNGVLAFLSVHTECPHCQEKIVCGCLDRSNEKFVIITETEYKELYKPRSVGCVV